MYPIGLERSKRQLVDLVNLSSTTITMSVGISGLGGVGKTTLAKAVYNEIHRTFDACSFLFNIGASAQNGSTLADLQRRILRDLVKYNGDVSSVDAGKVLMRDRLQGVRALVILDDVNHVSQLHAVCGDWFGPGSRLIIISRDRHILHHGTFPENPYEELSTRIAKACGGIPLPLIVMGAHLSDKKEPNDIECWKEAVMNVGENPDIFTVLRISYDGLSSVEKEIFLDIACCLLGEKKTEAVIFWEFFYPNKVQTAIKNLSLKMLINVHGREDLLNMHDLLWQMGRAIQEQSGKYSRLRLPMGPQNDLNTERAGDVNMLVYTGENRRKPVKLPSMPHLRYLYVQNTKLVGNIGNLAPNLIWIRVKNCEFLSDSHTWRMLRNRYQIDNWSQLRIFILEQCTTIKRIPGTLDSLVNLQRLSLVDCSALTTLPNALGNMPQLKKFILCGCASLTRLPDTVGNMEQLEEFYMGGCSNVKCLPSTIGNLAKLRLFNLDGCTNLKNLPETMGNLAQLQLLDLYGCTGLQRLPSTVGKLAQLRWLNIHGCSGLGSFEDMIVKLPELRRLNRYDGLGSLIEKRGLEDDQRENTDRLYSKSSKTHIQCTAMCETSADIEKSSEADSVGKIRRLIEEAILKSDILVPGGCTLPKCQKGTILMSNSDALVVPFYVDVEPFHDRGDVNPSLIRFAGDMYMEISLENQDKRTCTLWSVPWDMWVLFN
ncbi:hypothetical protein SUGI_1184130 [Cryptomeria japonica]|nr:hypothetical protein SUGI_1184130 [Cryptomeria japonica]